MDLILPLSTFYRENPDYNLADSINETRLLIQRQGMVDKVLSGDEQPDTLLDLLDSQGLDPIEYINSVEFNVQLVLENGILIH